MKKLTKAQVKFVNENLQDKSIIWIARELSQMMKLEGEKAIKRKDLIEYFKENFQRDIFKEKFNIIEE